MTAACNGHTGIAAQWLLAASISGEEQRQARGAARRAAAGGSATIAAMLGGLGQQDGDGLGDAIGDNEPRKTESLLGRGGYALQGKRGAGSREISDQGAVITCGKRNDEARSAKQREPARSGDRRGRAERGAERRGQGDDDADGDGGGVPPAGQGGGAGEGKERAKGSAAEPLHVALPQCKTKSGETCRLELGVEQVGAQSMFASRLSATAQQAVLPGYCADEIHIVLARGRRRRRRGCQQEEVTAVVNPQPRPRPRAGNHRMRGPAGGAAAVEQQRGAAAVAWDAASRAEAGHAHPG